MKKRIRKLKPQEDSTAKKNIYVYNRHPLCPGKRLGRELQTEKEQSTAGKLHGSTNLWAQEAGAGESGDWAPMPARTGCGQDTQEAKPPGHYSIRHLEPSRAGGWPRGP